MYVCVDGCVYVCVYVYVLVCLCLCVWEHAVLYKCLQRELEQQLIDKVRGYFTSVCES